MGNIILKIKGLSFFLKKGIWEVQRDELSKSRAILYQQIRILIIAGKGYVNDNCSLRASALTFYSLLSIVPVFAMLFGIAKGFGIEEVLEKQLREKLYGQGDVVEKVISFAKSLLESTSGGIIAGIGFVIVMYSVLNLLTSIEEAFNVAWKTSKTRSIYRKITDYTSFIVIAPILFTISSSISVFAISSIENITESIYISDFLSSLITLSLDALSFTLIWLLMILLYILLPNTQVKWRAAIQAGVVAGTAFILVQWAYFYFQIGASRASAIYGSFAALPLFLAWLQISWFIVIFGAEYAYAIQNINKLKNSLKLEKMNRHSLKIVALLITTQLVKRFEKGDIPQDATGLAKDLNLPLNLIEQTLELLIDSNVVSKVTKNGSYSFQPALDIDKISVSFVLSALEDNGKAITNSKAAPFYAAFKSFREITENSESNKLLKDIE
ncbi:MAG: YihY/virulence factor BrkB family protein [Bacteroidota bacterium]